MEHANASKPGFTWNRTILRPWFCRVFPAQHRENNWVADDWVLMSAPYDTGHQLRAICSSLSTNGPDWCSHLHSQDWATAPSSSTALLLGLALLQTRTVMSRIATNWMHPNLNKRYKVSPQTLISLWWWVQTSKRHEVSSWLYSTGRYKHPPNPSLRNLNSHTNSFRRDI